MKKSNDGAYLCNGTSCLEPDHATAHDDRGALMYVVVVISVYAMGIFFMIASHVRRRSAKKNVDSEITAYLRHAPHILQEEEMQRRALMKQAMKPFVDLVMHKRTVGVQTAFDDRGNWVGSNSFLAEYGVPGAKRMAFTQQVTSDDRVLVNKVQPVEGHHHHHHRFWFSRNTSKQELNPSLVLGNNDKCVQCNMDEHQKKMSMRSRHLKVPEVSHTGTISNLTTPSVDGAESSMSIDLLHASSFVPKIITTSSVQEVRSNSTKQIDELDGILSVPQTQPGEQQPLWTPSPKSQKKLTLKLDSRKAKSVFNIHMDELISSV